MYDRRSRIYINIAVWKKLGVFKDYIVLILSNQEKINKILI